MSEKAHFTAEEARAAGERIGVDWEPSQFDVEQFRKGMDVELEHGTRDLDTRARAARSPDPHRDDVRESASQASAGA